MITKNEPVKIHEKKFDLLMITVRGISSVISTSKIKKMTAIRKNRSENGRRADPLGSNPHSKGEFFSRSLIVFLARTEEISMTAVAMAKISTMDETARRIIFPGSPDPPVGSRLYLIY